jgi:predicted metallo-beta-lactamase superfamily hydrolase
MTDKDITKIAELTAKLVIDHIEARQDEWNESFNTSIENAAKDGFGNMRMLDEQEMLEMQITALQQELDKAIEDQDFKLASKINSKIIDLKTKRK